MMTSLLEIGDSLAATRRARGMSQRALGEAIGVKQQQVARWEATSYRTASLASVAAVANAVGFEPGDAERAAEEPAAYGGTMPAIRSQRIPVRDLGEVAARVRAKGKWLHDEYGVTSVAVFGSFATGSQTAGSDVDLLVDFASRDRVQGFRFVEFGCALEELLGRSVDVTQPHLIRERLKSRVLEEAVVVWAA